MGTTLPRHRATAADRGDTAGRRNGPLSFAAALTLGLLAVGVATAGPPADDELAPAAAAVAAGKHELALARLAELFEAGYATPSRALADPRFSPLREDRQGRTAWRHLMRQHARESRVTMVAPDEPGEPMMVRGRVVESPDGEPIAGAVLEIYHTDATGHYEPGATVGRDARARLFAFVRSDADGRFELETIKPAPYPGAGEGAAHVHFIIEAEGYRSYGADFRPYDHPRDPAERATSIERGWRFSTVRHEGDTLICEVTIPMRSSE